MKTFVRHYRIEQEVGEEIQKVLTLAERKRWGADTEPDEEFLRRYRRGMKDFEPHVKGGKTVATVVDDAGNEFIGVSRCSLEDNFCYAMGRRIAIGRAMKEYKAYKRHMQEIA